MKQADFQRRQVSALVFLLLAAFVALLVLFGPFQSWIEAKRQVTRLESLIQGQRTIIARSGRSQSELDQLSKNTDLQEQLLQGDSRNMAVTRAQGTLTSLVEKNGGKILRVANVTADSDAALEPVITSVHFECDNQTLNDILHAIEFGAVNSSSTAPK